MKCDYDVENNSVNPEAANNKNSLLSLHLSLSHVAYNFSYILCFYLALDSYYSVNILRNDPEENNKINNNEANNKAPASYIINLRGVSPSCRAYITMCIDCTPRASRDIWFKSGLSKNRFSCSFFSSTSLKLKRSIILLNSIIIVVDWVMDSGGETSDSKKIRRKKGFFQIWQVFVHL